MAAVLALQTGQDARSLLTLIREDPRAFDSLWYMAFPPDNSCDVDAILNGD